jgi:hypothetical protein
VPTAQAAEMVRHGVQVVSVWRYLQAGVIWRVDLRACAVDARWEWRGHVVGQVEAFERKVDVFFNLVRERSFEREALEVNEQYGRQSRKGERLGRFAERFAPWAVPCVKC